MDTLMLAALPRACKTALRIKSCQLTHRLRAMSSTDGQYCYK